MNIINKNLNLLIIFKVLMQELNVSKAAEALNMSQPAISHALNRLRADFQDPLFVRASKGVTPTPMALHILPLVNQILDKTEQIYEQQAEEASRSTRERLVISTTDYLEERILPGLIKKQLSTFPLVTLLSRNLNGIFPKAELERGEIDIAIAGYFKHLPEGYYQQEIFNEKFVCLVDPDKFKYKTLSLKSFLSAPHLLTTLTGDLDGIVDKKLARKNLKRHKALAVSNFLTTGEILKGSPMVLTCLEGVAHQVCKRHELKIFKPPVDLPIIKIVQVWHERTHNDHLRRWLRGSIKEACSTK